MKIRNLAISKLCCLGKYGIAEVPLIRLSGYWLEQLGYEIGDHISVEVTENNRLQLSLIPKQNNP